MMRATVEKSARKTKWSGPLAALILLASMPGLAQAVDFKGIKLGDRLGVLQERNIFGALDCNPMQLSADDYQDYLLEMQSLVPGAQKVCVATASIATVPADVTVILGTSRRVLRLVAAMSWGTIM